MVFTANFVMFFWCLKVFNVFSRNVFFGRKSRGKTDL